MERIGGEMIESAEEFYRLRTSEDPKEYLRAAHEEATLEVWRDVIQKFPDMREWVAHNKTIQLEILEELCDDPDPRVRFSVAMKNKLTAKLMWKLHRDADESVRSCIMKWKKTPRDLLELMANDPEEFVANKAKKFIASLDAEKNK